MAPASASRADEFLSYAPDVPERFERTVSAVDRILRGAKPAQIPVELPAKYQFAVNAKTARALGLALPQSLLMRTDRVIE